MGLTASGFGNRETNGVLFGARPKLHALTCSKPASLSFIRSAVRLKTLR